MAKIKVFQKYVKVQGHKVKTFGNHGKVLSQGMYMCNMKALPLLVRKLWPRLKFYRSRSNLKVKATRSTRHMFVKHGCPRRQQSRNMAKISLSPIF